MERGRGRGRGRGRSAGGGRQNVENPDRSNNPWFNPARPAPHPGNPPPPTANPWQNPAPQRWNPVQNPPRGNPVQNPPRGNPVQIPGSQPPPRANPWQSQGGAMRGSGGDQGGGRGRPRAFEYVPRGPVSDPTPSEPPVEELQQLKLSPSTSKTALERPARLPMIRPDEGGKDSVRRMELLVNHFKVKFNPRFTILHYDIDIKLENPPRPNAVVRVSKADALLLRNKLFSEELSIVPISKTAYDGEKNIYSAVELPTGNFTVTISKGEDTRPRTYIVSIKLVNKLELGVLDAYLKGKGQSVPRDILQGMDIIMRESPSRTQIMMGKGFYSKSSVRNCDLGDGIMACTGFQQSLKPTSQGLSQCVDHSILPFRKPVHVLEFLNENLKISFDSDRPLNRNLIGRVERALKGLKVRVTHRNTTQKFVVMGLTKFSTSQITFDLEDADSANSIRRVTLVDYFVEKYNQHIQYRHLPSLDFSKGKRTNFVPMEFCVLIEGQRYPKDDLNNYADRKLRDLSLLRPRERRQLICDMVNAAEDGPCGGEITRQFGITVTTAMTQVTSRVLSPPLLKLRGANNDCSALTPEGSCQYNLLNHKVVYGKDMIRWGILDFSQHWSNNRRYMPLEVDKFTRAFVQRSRKLGIRMENYLFYEESSMDILSNPKALSDLLKYVYHDLANGHLQILFCPMADKHQGYKTLKRICETEIGIMTQCCLSFEANKCQDQTLANIALKMNAKAGGSNMELYQQLPNLGGDGHVMFIGADVNHPTGHDGLSPSITAVAATMNWPGANRYASRLRAQHRGEKIQDIGEMCFELLEAYARINKVKPERIILFRDGVSETQFDMVLNEELTEIRRAIESDGYKPTITVVVAQKRHLTRLFPMNEREGGKSGNVPPGTVVDKIIVHLDEFDFYLNSHYGSIGTSKPTHYHVLWDDHAFSSDQLQRLIYNLCYTFPRCTKPISLVPPVYYADLVAYRGRQYYESLNDFRSPASTSSSSSSSTFSISSSPAADRINFPKLHCDLENLMICI
ncbi:hypothetical protein AAC387_Pa06g1922 [Persea americana]